MSVNLPDPLPEYFKAANAHDSNALIACFAPEAVVRDEGRDMHGLAAIRAWNEKTSQEYGASFSPIDVHQVDGTTDVTAQVAGNFAGSPIELSFRFKIANSKIEALEIG
jgi:hypothetical protein